MSIRYIIGIDEVGRGPLAGPVTVGVVMCESRLYTKLKKDKRLPPLGKDSKKLKSEDREKYSDFLKQLMKENKITYKVTHISERIIDTKGLSHAIKRAMSGGLNTCLKKLKIDPKQTEIRLDGGLKAPSEYTFQKTIIQGDEKEQIIAWASILAKVSRDELLVRASKRFPGYGFEIHKGYGTAKHRSQIRSLGTSSFHRKSFCRNFV